MANTPPLKLTRNQLAAFLKDHESIKAFENLFNLTEAIAPEAVQDALVAAESASASASNAQALALQAANDALSTAAVAEARANVALQTANDARSMAEIASTAPTFVMPPGSMGRYAQFLDTTTQTAAAVNTAYAITYDTTILGCGISLQPASSSRIQVNESGIYNFQFSVQLDKTSGGTARFWIWFRVNGVDVAASASEAHIQGNNHEIFSAANLLLPLLGGDYVELMWSVSDTSVQLTSRLAASPVPAVPCVIVTATNVVSPACGISVLPRPTYAQEVLVDAPSLYYRMGETSGSTADDIGSLNADGSYTGGFTLNQSGFVNGGKSVLFGGAASNGRLISGSSNNFLTTCTVECWANPSASGHGTDDFGWVVTKNLYFADTTSDFPIAIVWRPSTGRFEFRLANSSGFVWDTILQSAVLTAGQSYHIVGVYRASGLCELYIDGALAASSTISYTISTNSRLWTVGNATPFVQPASAGAFAGRIGEVAIYNTALSAQRIAAHYAARNN